MGEPISGDWRPVPDPTTLTVQLVARELESLHQQLDIRLAAMDKAQQLVHDDLVRVPTAVDKAIAHLKEVHDERFHTMQAHFEHVATQFVDHETRLLRMSASLHASITAAVDASKELASQSSKFFAEAAAKAEQGFKTEFEQQRNLLYAFKNGLDEKSSVQETRLTRIEAVASGVSGSWGVLLGAVGLLSLIAGLVMTITRFK